MSEGVAEPLNQQFRRLATVSILVHDYDEAAAWYRDKLGFFLIEDTDLGGGKRWVVVAPGVHSGARILLARAADQRQASRVGDQTGGRVGFFLETDDITRDFRHMLAQGVRFLEDPRNEAYGKVAVFTDLYGNLFDLIEPVEARD